MQFSFLWRSGRKFQREFIARIQIAFDAYGPTMRLNNVGGEIVFTGSVAEVRGNMLLLEHHLAV